MPQERTDTIRRRSLRYLAVPVLAGSLASCKPGGGPAAYTPPPTNVEVAPVKKGAVRETFKALGSVEAAESVRIAAEIDALVKELPFEEGRRVEKGEALAVLNDVELKADVLRAEALRDQARLSYDRLKELSGKRIASPQERDNADAVLKVAEANLHVAEARLSKTRVVAPFSGLVGRRLVSPGAFLKAGDAVTVLARMDEVKLVFSVPERILSGVRRGAQVTVTTTAHAGESFLGRVTMVEPMLDAGTRTAHVVALVPNPKGLLSPGMSAEVTALLSERAEALTVPDEAVFAEGDRSYVYVVKADSTVTRRAIDLGARLTGSAEVMTGLAFGETVVRAGHQKLYEGAKVAAVTSQESSPAPPGGRTGGAP